VTGPGGDFDATISALENCAEAMGRVWGMIATGRLRGRCAAAGEAAGDGPLAKALKTLRVRR
jgi:hypothetical protein